MQILYNTTSISQTLRSKSTKKLSPFKISPDIMEDLEKLQHRSSYKASEDNFSIFSKDTHSSSSFSLDSSDALSTHSSENLEENATVMNSALNEKKKSQTDETKFKTEMCKNWSESGQCPYGKKCKFAHGRKELHEKQVHNKTCYKTKKCNSFHNRMTCMYGVRCLFAHEARPLEVISSKSYYNKYICCPELLQTAQTSKKERLPVFRLKVREDHSDEALRSKFRSDGEEFKYFLDSFRAEKYVMYGF